MAKQYEVTTATLGVARITSWFARRGWGSFHVLTTTGRKSGEPRSVPVSPIEVEGRSYLVSPYGEVSWVRNARANPDATLLHGSTQRRVRLEEADGEAAAPVVAAYYERERFPRPYMDLPETPTLQDFEAAAGKFPVFTVTEAG